MEKNKSCNIPGEKSLDGFGSGEEVGAHSERIKEVEAAFGIPEGLEVADLVILSGGNDDVSFVVHVNGNMLPQSDKLQFECH